MASCRIWNRDYGSWRLPTTGRPVPTCAISAWHVWPPTQCPPWQEIADTTDTLLLNDVTENPGHFTTWVDALTPARVVDASLAGVVHGPFTLGHGATLIANILGQYLADQPAEPWSWR